MQLLDGDVGPAADQPAPRKLPGGKRLRDDEADDRDQRRTSSEQQENAQKAVLGE